MRRAFAPGRVNLIGEHTDYAGGLAVPMAIDLGTTVEGAPGGDVVALRSDAAAEEAQVPLTVGDPAQVEPPWARYVAGVVAELRPATGFHGSVRSTLPVGGGLSSSASLELAVALALGFEGDPWELARLGQRAEQRASGVPCGIMDQLASAHGRAGHVLRIDFATLAVEPVRLPEGCRVVVVHSGQPRTLAGSAYAERRAQVEEAAAVVGPLADALVADLAAVDDLVVRRRARHVITEIGRVRDFVAALRAGALDLAGGLMDESHVSLREDFEVSTPALEHTVDRVRAAPGVFGARLTGAGFGGCVVALCEPGALRGIGWQVEPADGARVL